jgi:hypothetical protein
MNRPARCYRLQAGLALAAAILLLSWPAPLASAQQGPSAPGPTSQEESVPEETWVQNHQVTEQWSGPDEGAEFFGWLRKFSYLRVEGSEGDRLYVYNPRTDNFAYVSASAIGPSGPPPSDYLEPFQVLAAVNQPGRVVGTTNLYGEPAADDGVWLRTLGHNLPVQVEAEVRGDGGSWYRLETGEFVSGERVRLPRPTSARWAGKWSTQTWWIRRW